MHIIYFTPYALDGNLGREYNYNMSLLENDDDWGVIQDGDTMFLTFDWGHHIAEVINKIPNAGIITCKTNRIRQKQQIHNEPSPNILVHRIIAKDLDKQFRGGFRNINKHISGFFMAIKKQTWKELGGFPEKKGVLLTIDNAFSKKVLRSDKGIYLMRGLYKFHYYRFAEGWNYTAHLRDAKDYVKNNPVSVSRRKIKLYEKNKMRKSAIQRRRNK